MQRQSLAQHTVDSSAQRQVCCCVEEIVNALARIMQEPKLKMVHSPQTVAPLSR